MHTWSVLGQDSPELRQEFDEACAEVRAILRHARLGTAVER
jgi:hypothetical protein